MMTDEKYNTLIDEHMNIVLDIENMDDEIRVAECNQNGGALRVHLREMRGLLKRKKGIECSLDILKIERMLQYYEEKVKVIDDGILRENTENCKRCGIMDWFRRK